MKVLVCDPYDFEGLRKLRERGFDVDEKPGISAEDLMKIVGEYDALMVRSRTKVTKEVLQAGVRLKAIARAGVGLDNVDLEYTGKRDIKVVSTPEAPTSSAAELAVALMLGVLRQIGYADRSLKERKWIKSSLMGRELKGKIVGVIGAGGRIGDEVTRILQVGFRCHVIGFDVTDIRRRGAELGFEIAESIDDLLARADIVTLHVPYLPSTHHLINAKRIRVMKQNSVLINTSRGDIVDGKALLDALTSGHLGGAGLDVYHDEPPMEEWERQLVSLPNTLCTCHIGAQTEESQLTASVIAAEKLIDILKP